MTDYLEEHLGNAEALLKRIRQMEQSVSDLSYRANSEENVENIDDYAEKEREYSEKSEKVSKNKEEVYDLEKEVNQAEYLVDNTEIVPKNLEKEEDFIVNRRTERVDNDGSPERPETTVKEEENETRTNAERAESRSALSAQLEELDRTVSALTALIPERGESAQGGYPISLALPQGPPAGPDITGAPGEAWSGPGAADRAGFAYGGTRSWAEQADRVFRRDSRRYDGGFYLY